MKSPSFAFPAADLYFIFNYDLTETQRREITTRRIQRGALLSAKIFSFKHIEKKKGLEIVQFACLFKDRRDCEKSGQNGSAAARESF